MNPNLISALRQFCHNNGEPGFVMAYDKDIVDREFAILERVAAAPLPQVQSEALDAAQMARGRASVAMMHGYCTAYPILNDTPPEETTELAKLRGAYATGWEAARAFDQQPVTPSGALADNDGGVA